MGRRWFHLFAFTGFRRVVGQIRALGTKEESILMKLIVLAVVLPAVVMSGLVFARSQPQVKPEAPTSAAAIGALSNYTAAVRKLDDEYSRRLSALQLLYIKELDAARKVSLQHEDLDEALRLLAERKRVEAGSLQFGNSRGMAILSAVFGIDDRWMDITPRVRRLVRNGRFHYSPGDWADLPDVAEGRHKMRIIAYTVDGKVYVSTTQDNEPDFDLPGR